jgi:transketolase
MRQVALDTVYELAKTNSKILFIGSDLGAGTLKTMKSEIPNQFFMEGISEQHIIGFAAGLAKEGFTPFLNTIANFFTRRALEQIILDVALHNLPVKILASGGGMVYAPLGPTHTATDDLAHMLAIPNVFVYSPADADEMHEIIKFESTQRHPAYIRFGKGDEKLVTKTLQHSPAREFKFKGSLDAPIVLLTTGVALQVCLESQKVLGGDSNVLVLHTPHLNIQDFQDLKSVLSQKAKLIVVEEHQEIGGLLTQVMHYLNKNRLGVPHITSVCLGSSFIRRYGNQRDHFEEFGLTVQYLTEMVGK